MKLTEEQRTREVHFILNEDKWPNWPILPVKRSERKHPTDSSTGIIIAGLPTIVYLINMWDLKSGPLDPQLENARTIKYKTVEQMIEDDWMVD